PASGEITSHYGPGHPLGIDIAQASGPIRAATDGVVFFAGGSPCCSYGRFVVIDGPDGIRTLYAHFESIAVKTGERVKAGQVIGEIGCSGTCSGPHLHFEVFDRGVRRNPLLYLP
ncbi:MAG TPA: M23 family metallopeptidase, partial [Dehalococcoidia bacterium]|nr:M23 family metallopeptidase [Dehalococcoidia bacterium]